MASRFRWFSLHPIAKLRQAFNVGFVFSQLEASTRPHAAGSAGDVGVWASPAESASQLLVAWPESLADHFWIRED